MLPAIVYVTNRTATSLLDGKTPLQYLLELTTEDDDVDADFTQSVAHLRVLGCKTYVIIQKEVRVVSQKLAPRAQVGILVGYEGKHIYQVYLPYKHGRGKVVRSSYVRFDEGGVVTEEEVDHIDEGVSNSNRESNPHADISADEINKITSTSSLHENDSEHEID